MKNVTQENANVSQQLKGYDNMKYNDKMADAITDFILNNDFLTRYIVDNVKDKIYTERTYYDGMIEQVLINDLDSQTDGYIIGFILDEIDIYTLIDKIDDMYRDDFLELERQCNNRNY